MKKFRLSPVSVALTAIAALSLILCIVGAFVLPSQLRTHLSLNGATADTMNKLVYLPFAAFLICISSAAGLFLKNKRVRYLVVASVLCLMNIAVFVANMI